ncbi:MAG: hypothetical protein JOZ73_07630 [Solirubrobacterales bacterium]|nr:hypothetical protein [Solirubrobacterales bacterium]
MAVTLALGLLAAGCGHKEAHPTVGDTEGVYVDSGPITYQVQLSRELNPFSQEDRGYLVGVKGPAPKPNEEWFAIFLWAKNQAKSPAATANSFDIVDTQGHTYRPVALNPVLNPYAWTSQTLKPLQTEPAPDTTASFGPTQGAELLFKINTTAYSNRPLTFEIHSRGQSVPSAVSLDL